MLYFKNGNLDVTIGERGVYIIDTIALTLEIRFYHYGQRVNLEPMKSVKKIKELIENIEKHGYLNQPQ